MHDELLRKLNSKDKAVRGEALHEARALPPDELFQLLQDGTRLYKKRSRAGMTLVAVILTTTFVYSFGKVTVTERTGWLLWLPIVATIGTIVFLLTYLPRKMYAGLSKLLNEINDVRFIGPAFAMLPYAADFPAMSGSLRGLLVRLLKQIRADHASQITPETKKQIPGLLVPTNTQDVWLAALKALGQIGDESAIPRVQALWGSLATQRNPELQEAIEECLALLQASANERRQAQTLLRASSQTEAAPETLLRAAVAGNEATAPEQLLRPR